jgi:hypothetical protein
MKFVTTLAAVSALMASSALAGDLGTTVEEEPMVMEEEPMMAGSNWAWIVPAIALVGLAVAASNSDDDS